MNIKTFYERDFIYLKITVSDGVMGIRKHFSKTFSFIENGDVVFVHCRQGVSRSATVVISYLMRKKSWSLERALAFVKDKRPVVNPHFLFYVELNLFQEEVQ